MLHAPTSDTKTETSHNRPADTPLLARDLHPRQSATVAPRSAASISSSQSARSPIAPDRQAVAQIQATYGNQAALRMLNRSVPVSSDAPTSGGRAVVQRKCACGGTPGPDGECAACKAKRLGLQRAAATLSRPATAPPIIHEVPHTPGHLLDTPSRAFMEPRFGYDFSRPQVRGEAGTSQASGSAEQQPAQRESQAQGIAGLSSKEAQIDVAVKVIRPPASSRLTAALSMAGEEVEGDDEDVITAQTPGGPIVSAPPGSPAATCNYVITYANERNNNCDGGRCGAQIVFDITGVTATGAGCPATLDGLMLTEVVTNDHGCSPANVQGGAGCPIEEHPPLLPGHGIVRNCTDTYGVCLGSVSQARIPPAGCTETVTQQLFIGGVLAETHLIRFRITKTASGCTGTVNRT